MHMVSDACQHVQALRHALKCTFEGSRCFTIIIFWLFFFWNVLDLCVAESIKGAFWWCASGSNHPVVKM